MKYAVIVDPIVSGNGIAYEFISRGVQCICVWSSKESYEANFRAFATEFFILGFVFTDVSDFAKLEKYDIVAVTPGSDYGIELAERIGLHLNLPYTNTTGFDLRNDRELLTRKLKEETYTGSYNSILQTISKPKKSYGGFDRIEIRESGSVILEDEFFAQPLYHGTEYAVDTVSYNGTHKLLAVWKYTKNGIQRSMTELLDGTDPVISEIYVYISKVLNTARYLYGAAHTEIIFTNKGFRLIECNFRSHGHMDFVSAQKCFGKNQVQVLVDALMGNSNTFSGENSTYTNNGYMLRTYFVNHTERPANSINWRNLEMQPSVAKVYRSHAYYETMAADKYDLRNVAANIIMYNVEKSTLMNDYEGLKLYLAGI